MSSSKNNKATKPKSTSSTRQRATRNSNKNAQDNVIPGRSIPPEQTTQPIPSPERRENRIIAEFGDSPDKSQTADELELGNYIEADLYPSGDSDSEDPGNDPRAAVIVGAEPPAPQLKRVKSKSKHPRRPTRVISYRRGDSDSDTEHTPDYRSRSMSVNRPARLTNRRDRSCEKRSRHRRSLSEGPERLHTAQFGVEFNRLKASAWLYSLRAHCIFYGLHSEHAKFTLILSKLPVEVLDELGDSLPDPEGLKPFTKMVKLIRDRYQDPIARQAVSAEGFRNMHKFKIDPREVAKLSRQYNGVTLENIREFKIMEERQKAVFCDNLHGKLAESMSAKRDDHRYEALVTLAIKEYERDDPTYSVSAMGKAPACLFYNTQRQDMPRNHDGDSRANKALSQLANKYDNERKATKNAVMKQSQTQRSTSRLWDTVVPYDWDRSPYDKSKCCKQHQIFADTAFFCRWRNTCPMRAVIQEKKRDREDMGVNSNGSTNRPFLYPR